MLTVLLPCAVQKKSMKIKLSMQEFRKTLKSTDFFVPDNEKKFHFLVEWTRVLAIFFFSFFSGQKHFQRYEHTVGWLVGYWNKVHMLLCEQMKIWTEETFEIECLKMSFQTFTFFRKKKLYEKLQAKDIHKISLAMLIVSLGNKKGFALMFIRSKHASI